MIINKTFVESFQDEVPPILVYFISPGKFATFVTKVNKVAIVYTIPEDTKSSRIGEVFSKLL